jgi:hypothetical protein
VLVTLFVPVVVLEVLLPALLFAAAAVVVVLELSVVPVFVVLAGTVIPLITVVLVVGRLVAAAESLSLWFIRSLTFAGCSPVFVLVFALWVVVALDLCVEDCVFLFVVERVCADNPPKHNVNNTAIDIFLIQHHFD